MFKISARIMLWAVCLAPLSVLAFTIPAQPTGFVQDYAHILTADQVATLETKLEAYEKQSTNEIAVVTIQSLDGDTIENVAQDIFTQWGIGKKDKNNGVLFLISVGDRKTRIHTGYGVEGNLTDIGTSYIQSDIVKPAFRSGDYYGGINSAVDTMIESLGGADIVPKDFTPTFTPGKNWDLVFFVGFVILQFIGAILGKSKSWWAGGVLGGIIGGIMWFFDILHITRGGYIVITIVLVFFGLVFDLVLSRARGARDKAGMPPWWFFLGGGKGGGGSSGGGFGGFGGGWRDGSEVQDFPCTGRRCPYGKEGFGFGTCCRGRKRGERCERYT
jgi:uncharacterized protein